MAWLPTFRFESTVAELFSRTEQKQRQGILLKTVGEIASSSTVGYSVASQSTSRYFVFNGRWMVDGLTVDSLVRFMGGHNIIM
jgi:hypothetical protein